MHFACWLLAPGDLGCALGSFSADFNINLETRIGLDDLGWAEGFCSTDSSTSLSTRIAPGVASVVQTLVQVSVQGLLLEAWAGLVASVV